MNNRDLVKGEYVGIDIQEGADVDHVLPAASVGSLWPGRFSSIICSEVLEHVEEPQAAFNSMIDALAPGGHLIITTLFAFPEHNYPHDYFRYSRQGIALLFDSAGFEVVDVSYAGGIEVQLNDHGEQGTTKRVIPMHVFGTGRKP